MKNNFKNVMKIPNEMRLFSGFIIAVLIVISMYNSCSAFNFFYCKNNNIETVILSNDTLLIGWTVKNDSQVVYLMDSGDIVETYVTLNGHELKRCKGFIANDSWRHNVVIECLKGDRYKLVAKRKGIENGK